MPDVVGAVPGEPEQVHPRGEGRAGAGQDEGADVLGDAVELRVRASSSSTSSALDLPVRQAEGEDAFMLRT